MNAAVEDALSKFSAGEPEKTAPALAEGLRQTLALIKQVDESGLAPAAKYNVRHELEIKRVQFNDALAEALATLVICKGCAGEWNRIRLCCCLWEIRRRSGLRFRAEVQGECAGGESEFNAGDT